MIEIDDVIVNLIESNSYWQVIDLGIEYPDSPDAHRYFEIKYIDHDSFLYSFGYTRKIYEEELKNWDVVVSGQDDD